MPTSASEFLEFVRRSGVVEADLLTAYVRSTNLPTEAAECAAQLVRDGVLTHFQADRLRQGKWRGFVISEKYRLLEQIGAGGMGAVFLALHLRMGSLVALKMLAPERVGGPATLERFEREARAAANLNHPNLVRAFDIDEDDGVHYLVMEYVHGASLQHLGRGRLPAARATEYARQAALGLAAAHAAGLIHRDVKPSNLLLDATGTVKVVDLGLARFIHDRADKLTDEQTKDAILGTADYLAPEQALDSTAVDARADVYGLGATLYFLLTGRPPFSDGTVGEKLIAHQVRTPPPLDRADVPPGLDAAVRRMMAKDPDDRFQTTAEVADELARWVSEPVPPPAESDLPELCPAVRNLLPRSSTAPARRLHAASPARVRRRWWRAGAVACVLLAATVGVSGWVYQTIFPSYIPPPPVDRTKVPDPFQGIDGDKLLGADQAFGSVGQKRTVRIHIKGRDRNPDTGAIRFYSRTSGTDPKVFTVVIGPAVVERLRAVGVKSPYDDFFNESIEVTGLIAYLDNAPGRPVIEVTEPGQVRKVEPH
ncbi:serine threonine protein kinase : Putative serine/threonine protein kinase (Fragment) OS=Gemmata sp. Wa1-1 PE=3 SV=1: Pkinase [Gemmata massiliana]|uniref:Protein kinase domain-containing protein n=1 Tax=Gemmata massiliana TaxID=1210884 RepID=A0A6P2DJD9_9BACT